MAPRAQRYVHDAGAQFRCPRRREPTLGNTARPITLNEDVGAFEQHRQRCLALALAQIDVRRELAASSIHIEARNIGEMRPRHAQHIRTMRRQRTPTYGSGKHSRQVQHTHGGERPSAGRQRTRRCVADLHDLDKWQARDGHALRMGCPFRRRAHHGADKTSPRDFILVVLTAPAFQRVRDRLPLVGHTEHVENALAMMREIRMEANPAAIARLVGSGDLVPGCGRRLAIDRIKPLADELGDGMAHVDAHLLRATIPHPVDLACGQCRRRDGCLGNGASPE